MKKEGRGLNVQGLFLLMLLCLFIISGCGANLPDKPHHVGHVVAIDEKEKKILVISALTDEEALHRSVEELLEIDQQRGRSAIWYTGGGIKYEIGDRVRVWIKGDMDDSYPGEAKVLKLEKFN